MPAMPTPAGEAAGGAAAGGGRSRPKWMLALAAVLMVALAATGIALGVVYGRVDGDKVRGWWVAS